MLIAITGHTSGIGYATKEHLVSEGHDVIGLSRSNGFDIVRDREKVVEAILPCDVFINNAQEGFAQTELLYAIWGHWRKMRKTIVSVNSMIVRVDWPLEFHPWLSQYKITKLALDSATKQLQQATGNCFVGQVVPGFVDTPMLPKSFDEKRKLDPKAVAQTIAQMLGSSGGSFIQEITLGSLT